MVQKVVKLEMRNRGLQRHLQDQVQSKIQKRIQKEINPALFHLMPYTYVRSDNLALIPTDFVLYNWFYENINPAQIAVLNKIAQAISRNEKLVISEEDLPIYSTFPGYIQRLLEGYVDFSAIVNYAPTEIISSTDDSSVQQTSKRKRTMSRSSTSSSSASDSNNPISGSSSSSSIKWKQNR